jgi:alkanesulfonate monooxygenase SsuD/methylene tetrahydromethanopterin reductase-like flavin-dependent oxidoreductase (luciferase family)
VDVGIGMPNAIPGTTGRLLLDWARRAEAAGFSSLATIGAVEYPSHEELSVFAAAGAVTERIRFMTNVMIAPARSTAELAKQAATVQQLTGGRLSLGLGVGWRQTDYGLTGRDFASRGRLFDEQLAGLRRALAGEPIDGGPRPVAPDPGAHVPVLIGGTSDAAVRRTVEFADGWTAGGTPPEYTAPMLDKVRAAWRDAGREGEPRFVALNYFALGDVADRSRAYVEDYYAPMGREMVEMIAGGVHRSADSIRAARDGFAEIGVHEVVFDPTVADLEQVDLLAEALR